jgi:hypothetical protein
MAAICNRLVAAITTSPDRFEAHDGLVTAAMCYGRGGDFKRAAEFTREATGRGRSLSAHRALHSAAAAALCLAPTSRFGELGEHTRGVVELVREEGHRTCNQAIIGLAARLLWLFETMQDSALAEVA